MSGYEEQTPEEYREKAHGQFNGRDRALLARIDERVQGALNEVKTIRDTYVTKAEFAPVKTFVYGMVAATSLTVLGAVLALVVRQ